MYATWFLLFQIMSCRHMWRVYSIKLHPGQGNHEYVGMYYTKIPHKSVWLTMTFCGAFQHQIRYWNHSIWVGIWYRSYNFSENCSWHWPWHVLYCLITTYNLPSFQKFLRHVLIWVSIFSFSHSIKAPFCSHTIHSYLITMPSQVP